MRAVSGLRGYLQGYKCLFLSTTYKSRVDKSQDEKNPSASTSFALLGKLRTGSAACEITGGSSPDDLKGKDG